MFPRARQPRVAFFCRGETRLLRIGRETRDDVGFDRLAQELGFEDMSDVDPADLPASECLADVVERTLPYFDSAIVPDLVAEATKGGAVLVVAHGNSLRALRKHLDGRSDDEIVDLEIPTGIPFRYVLDDEMRVIEGGYLGDPAAAAKAADAVAKQAG